MQPGISPKAPVATAPGSELAIPRNLLSRFKKYVADFAGFISGCYTPLPPEQKLEPGRGFHEAFHACVDNFRGLSHW
jgi:hypothetical protein